jgi:PAS domain S-box-containing protein
MKILVVEDNEASGSLIEILLVRRGYLVERAANGVEALEKALVSPPDLIVSDVMMPELDGFMLCRRIKADPKLKKTPVILYTATNPEKDEAELARSLGAARFIGKLAQPPILLDAIQEELEKSKKSQTAAAQEPAAGEDWLHRNYLEVLTRKLKVKEKDLEDTLHRLAESDKRYRELLESAPAPMAIHSDGALVYVNPPGLKLIGAKNPEQTIGLKIAGILIPDALDSATNRPARAGGDNEPTPLMEAKLRRLDGQLLEVEIAEFPVIYEGRNARHLVVQNISERKRAEEEIRIKEMYLDSATDAFIVHDLDGRLIYVNEAACKLHGYSKKELLGLNLHALNIPENEALIAGRIGSIMEHRQGPFETAHLRKDGGIIPLEIHARCVEIYGKKIVISVARDISERKRAEEELRQMQKMDSIGQLSGGIAHDLNNLLGPILGYADFLRKSMKAEDPRLVDVEEIIKAADLAAGLVRRLLAFSRKQVLDSRIINLNDTIAEMDLMVRRVIGPNIDLDLKLDKGIGSVKADPGQMTQVILNLVLNARDAMPQGGKITIETAARQLSAQESEKLGQIPPGKYVVLSVIDTGCGMNEALKTKVFEPFFTTKKLGKGLGLGLPTAFGIVKHAGGSIQLESVSGKGSVFRVFLPVTTTIEPAAGGEPVPAAAPAAAKGRVLLVEDDDSMRGMVKRVLTMAGFTVMEAVNGKEALKLLAAGPEPVDLMISDLIMPEMDGIALSLEVASKYPRVKILCMSGYAGKGEDLEKLLGSKTEYLPKPFKPDALLLKIDGLLTRKPNK